MSSASPAPAPLCAGGAPAGNRNAAKGVEKFFNAYTLATHHNPEQDLTDEELAEARAQRIKLKKAIYQLKANDARREYGGNLLGILDRRVAQGAKRLHRHTEKSNALDEAKAQLQVCKEH